MTWHDMDWYFIFVVSFVVHETCENSIFSLKESGVELTLPTDQDQSIPKKKKTMTLSFFFTALQLAHCERSLCVD